MTDSTCQLCGEQSSELCNDLICRTCHKSVSFEECVSGAWERRVRQAAGLPVRDAAEVEGQ
jgi:LRP1 type putative zinc finger protein